MGKRKEFLRRLKALEGQTFELPTRYVPYSGRRRHLKPYEYLEKLAADIASEVYGEEAVREPNGGNSFPDFAIKKHSYEVKTAAWHSKKFTVGTANLVARAFSMEDPKYLDAKYLVFIHTQDNGPSSFKLQKFRHGAIYDLSAVRSFSGHKCHYPSSAKIEISDWCHNLLVTGNVMGYRSGYEISLGNVRRTFRKVGIEISKKELKAKKKFKGNSCF